MSSDGDRPRQRRSWRELDATRDRARPREERRPGSPGDAAPRGYRAQLERLFETGGIGKLVQEREKLIAEGRATPETLPHALGLEAPRAAAPPLDLPRAPATPAAASVESEPDTRAVISPQAAAPAPSPSPQPRGPTRLQLVAKVRDAVGRDAITKAIDALLKVGALPDDFEVLGQALDHRSEEIVQRSLGQLEALLLRERPRRERVLAARLRMIEEVSAEPELRALAGRVRARL